MDNNEIYYKRGLHLIDKLLGIFTNDDSFYDKRKVFIKNEYNRFLNFYDLVIKDSNSFTMTGLVALLGMNKENIERVDKNCDYNFSRFDKKEREVIEAFKRTLPDFEKDRILNTKYDEWLNVTNLDYPTVDYIYNVRNGLLHSEYDFYDDRGSIIYIKNGNYTKFEGKILLHFFREFVSFYFGNNSWTGLSEKSRIFSTIIDKKIENDNDLDEVIGNIELYDVSYKLDENSGKVVTPEEKIYGLLHNNGINDNVYDEIDRIFRNNTKGHAIVISNIDENDKKIVKKMIDKYYGSNFYNMELDHQTAAILNCTRYLLDSRNVISEWIIDYIKLIFDIKVVTNTSLAKKNGINKIDYNINDFFEAVSVEDNLRSVFASKTALLFIKAYHILYRLQNKTFEEVDYNSINFDFSSLDYKYTRIEMDGSVKINDFSNDILKIKTKNSGFSDDEAKRFTLCEIIRDALSHGNINMKFVVDNNDNLKEYVVFNDNYHSKIRKIEMTIDKFEKFLCSDAFLAKNCVVKKGTVKIKK